MKGDIPQRSIRSSISRIVEFIAPRMISSVMASTAGGESGDAGPWVTTRSDLALMERIVAERRRGKAPWGATAPHGVCDRLRQGDAPGQTHRGARLQHQDDSVGPRRH